MATCPMSQGKAGGSNALSSLMSDNPRYAEMFDVNSQSANANIDGSRDYTDDMNALRDAGAVQKGSLRALLGVPDTGHLMGPPRDEMTFFSYRACEIGFRENLVFSSEGYNESAGVRSIGPTILSMVGKPHKRLRSAAQRIVQAAQGDRLVEQALDRGNGRYAARPAGRPGNRRPQFRALRPAADGDRHPRNRA